MIAMARGGVVVICVSSCFPGEFDRELCAGDPGQGLALEHNPLATSVQPHGTDLSGQVADVCDARWCIDGKTNGLVIVGVDHTHVAAGLAHRWYRGLIQGVPPWRVAAVRPIHRVVVRV